MISIGIIGPESTGKSTLAAYLANRYKGLLIPEYARTYMEQLNRPYTYEDVVAIAKHQITNEQIFWYEPVKACQTILGQCKILRVFARYYMT